MAKSNNNFFKKFSSIFRRAVSKQMKPEDDKKKFNEHIKESALRSARPTAEEEIKEPHKDDNKPEP